MNESEKAKRIIADNIYMTIATATSSGEPWISPVFFAYDESYNLYWVSNKESKHSALIAGNPNVAIVVFDSRAPEGNGDGVYFECRATELSNEGEINKAIKMLDKRVTKDEFRVKSIQEVTNESIWRIYRAAPLKVSKLGDGKIVNGQYVDSRMEVKLTDD